MELDGLPYRGFALLQCFAGRGYASEVRGVGAVIGGAVALDHDRILAHDSPSRSGEPGFRLRSGGTAPALTSSDASRPSAGHADCGSGLTRGPRRAASCALIWRK